ncbi:MAG: hypothetical protein KGK09_09945, partial [Burkholderiales bacterium]|nr:hypothetical protein [Burkholderiales bacterium]
LAVALAALVAGTLLRFPVAPGLLAVAFTAYAAALLRWPSAWLWVLPAALPVLDLAPLSGWFMFDEFDLAVLVTVAALLWRAPARHRPPLAPLTVAAWSLFALSVLVSAAIGLLPLTPLDANAFASYYSHYNALRVGKGFVWAFWLLWLTRRAGLARADLERPLTGGIVIGLAGATALALWERIVFPGLLDFSQDYRVGAFFSGMHTGGSDVEATLVLTMPFVLAAAWATRRAWVRLGCGLLFGAASYVLMVTYARGGWGAGFVALALAGALFVRSARRQGARRRAGWVAGAVALALVLGAAVGAGRFAQQRLASSAPDLGVRLTHWRETLEMMDPGWVTDAFGMGLGRFPETYYFRNRDGDEPATFRYAADAGGSYLKLGSGRTLYVEQLVDVRPRQRYRLALDLRAAGAAASLNVLVCARTYFVGYGCQSATLATGGAAAAGAWVHRTATIDSHGLGAGPWLWRRPVKLSLENATPGTTLDVRDVALVGEDGVDLVRNGSFAGGRDHWFFSSTFNHLPWHVKNLWLGLYFDQGWLGVVAFGLLLLQALAGLARAAWRGSPGAIAALAAVVGFVLVGLFGSLFDAPRLSLLFLLVLGGFGGRPA